MNRRNTPLLAGLAVVLCLGLFWVMDPSVEPEMAAAEDVPTRPLNHPPSAVRPTPAGEPVTEEGDQPWPEEGPPTEPEAVAAPEAPVTGSVWPISIDGIDGAIREPEDALADALAAAAIDKPLVRTASGSVRSAPPPLLQRAGRQAAAAQRRD